MRCFICINVADDVIKEVARIQGLLGKQNFRGKLTELENLHLTLKFLGEVDENNVEKVKERLGKINFKEFDAVLDSMGLFNYKGNPKIVWIKFGGKGIFDLQEKIDNSLKDLFGKEERFMSHMTIARIKQVGNKKEFSKYIKNMGLKKIKFRVSSFNLMKSDLRKLGPVYEVINEFNSET